MDIDTCWSQIIFDDLEIIVWQVYVTGAGDTDRHDSERLYFCFMKDRQTNRQTFAIVESLSRTKIND